MSAAVRIAFSNYYRAELGHADECLADIVKIMEDKDALDTDVINQILERMVKYYER